MRALAAFGRFWWDFVVGDDPVVALVVAVALAVTAVLNAAGLAGWWLLPVAAVAGLGGSLWRVVRAARRAPDA
jgi:hypothetical protein